MKKIQIKGIEIRGIKIKIHPTFIVLLVIWALVGELAPALLVFSLVMLHELAHTLVALAYGIKVGSIELYPYGGTAVLEDTFEGRRKEETLIALAGPALNFALLLFVQLLRREGLFTGQLGLDLVRINFSLACFNLLPVLPLDGGRIVRASLAGFFGFVRTTKFLAAAGKWLGGILIIAGFWLQAFAFLRYEPALLIILGGFFWVGSGKELANARIVFLKQLCRKKERLLRQGLMVSHTFTVSKETPFRRIIEEFTTDTYALVNVLGKSDGIEKIFSETEIIQGMVDYGIECHVGRLFPEK